MVIAFVGATDERPRRITDIYHFACMGTDPKRKRL